MKKNIYYHQVLKPASGQQLVVVLILQAIAQTITLPLKVFVRKHFGERYFSIVPVVFILVLLALVPFRLTGLWDHILMLWDNVWRSNDNGGYHYTPPDFEWWDFFKHYTSWYILLYLCFKKSRERQKEIEREPSVFDFAKYSLYSGEIWTWFYSFKIKGKKVDIRQVEVLVEPAFFFVIGLALVIFQQYIGFYLLVAGLANWWYMWSFYRSGDNFIMDMIDEMICNEDMAETMLSGKEGDESERGFRFYGQRPTDPDLRSRIVNEMVDEDEPAEAR